jgi:hypothetical protein
MTAMSYLDDLAAATRAAEAAEAGYRREAAARLAALETARALAYRRLNWMKAVVEIVAVAEDQEGAAAQARTALRARLGWSGDDETHAEVLARFAAVAETLFAHLTPEAQTPPATEAADVGAALAAFEAWYDEAHGRSFWALFEHYIPETPLVDF